MSEESLVKRAHECPPTLHISKDEIIVKKTKLSQEAQEKPAYKCSPAGQLAVGFLCPMLPADVAALSGDSGDPICERSTLAERKEPTILVDF